VASLAVDYYLHESPSHMLRSILRKLRQRNPPSCASQVPAVLLPVPQLPLRLLFLPGLLLGPSGCGKSTLLGAIASSLPQSTPVVLVRMRLPATKESPGGATTASAEMDPAKTLFNATARQVFSQIGFPLRRSFVGGLLSRGGFTLKGERTQAELSSTSDRLVLSLQLLFEACEILKHERQKTMSALDAAPLILFDEVQDLIKDDRLKRAGGQVVLDMLGSLLVAYCVDRRAVRSVLTGNSAELYFALAATTPLRDARNYYDLQDPAQGDVAKVLIDR